VHSAAHTAAHCRRHKMGDKVPRSQMGSDGRQAGGMAQVPIGSRWETQRDTQSETS